MKPLLLRIWTLILFLAISGPAISSGAEAGAAGAQGKDADLAQELSNPLADLMTIPIQMNYDRDIGPRDDGWKLQTNIQPVIPFHLNDNWNLISRTIMPVIHQDDIFPGINCLTSGGSIHKLNLEPINALVVLADGLLPYVPEDAPYLLDYVKEGGGLYVAVRAGGRYWDSVVDFLEGLGLEDAGPRLAKDPKHFGISAHAPSELVFELDGSAKRFTSRVGPWGHYKRSTISFDVYGDGRPLYRGELLRNGCRYKCDIAIYRDRKPPPLLEWGADFLAGYSVRGPGERISRMANASDPSSRLAASSASRLETTQAAALGRPASRASRRARRTPAGVTERIRA